jgi:[CysO sulfur-carrier protein]-S-L-cysteine hydrolase
VLVLRLTDASHLEIVAHALDGIPLEACGLIAGRPGDDKVERVYRCRNAAESSRLYELDPLDHLKADRDAESRGLEIIGVYHSHTHTDSYPSPTDVAQAPDPGWHYVIVSLKDAEPVLRSFRIVDGVIAEEPVSLQRR